MAKIRVITTAYEWAHGHKPRQERFAGASAWMFEVDGDDDYIRIVARYQDALKQAKQAAKHVIEVLP